MGSEWATEAVRQLGIEVPIVAAPMGGGPSTPALVAAVSEAGGLGSLAGGYLSPERLRSDIAAVREATSKPFAVNLFAPTPSEPSAEAVERALVALEPYRLQLELPPQPNASGPRPEDFDAQVAEKRPGDPPGGQEGHAGPAGGRGRPPRQQAPLARGGPRHPARPLRPSLPRGAGVEGTALPGLASPALCETRSGS